MREQGDDSDAFLTDDAIAHELRVLSLAPDMRPYFVESSVSDQMACASDHELQEQLRMYVDLSRPQSSHGASSNSNDGSLTGGGGYDISCVSLAMLTGSLSHLPGGGSEHIQVSRTSECTLPAKQDSHVRDVIESKKRKRSWLCPGCGQTECMNRSTAHSWACPGCGKQQCCHVNIRKQSKDEPCDDDKTMQGGGIYHAIHVEPQDSKKQSCCSQLSDLADCSVQCHDPSLSMSNLFWVAGDGKQTFVCVSYVCTVSTCGESGSVLGSRDLPWYTKDISSLKYVPSENRMCHVSKQSRANWCSPSCCIYNVFRVAGDGKTNRCLCELRFRCEYLRGK